MKRVLVLRTSLLNLDPTEIGKVSVSIPDLASVEASFERTQFLVQQGPGVASMSKSPRAARLSSATYKTLRNKNELPGHQTVEHHVKPHSDVTVLLRFSRASPTGVGPV